MDGSLRSDTHETAAAQNPDAVPQYVRNAQRQANNQSYVTKYIGRAVSEAERTNGALSPAQRKNIAATARREAWADISQAQNPDASPSR